MDVTCILVVKSEKRGKEMKTNLSMSLILILILSVISCTQSDDENNDNPFSFRITIKDNLGNPVEGFEVFFRNKISIEFENEIRPVTFIEYALSQECNLKLEVFDLNNNLVNSLINEVQTAGTYHYNYNAINNDSGEPIIGGCTILKCNIIATDIETQEVLYDETKFMCRYCFGAIIGLTDSNGLFYTDTKLYFPHLYDIPEMECIDEDGNILGMFTLQDTIEIKIYDPMTETYQLFDRVVEEGENNFDLIWDSNRNRTNISNLSNPKSNIGNRDVDLSSFSVSYIVSYINNVVIEWSTQSEIDNWGWNIYRSLSNNFEQSLPINSNLILGSGSSSEPVHYSYIDDYSFIVYSTYWYWLESIDINGFPQIFGPVSITIPDEEPIPPVWHLQNYPNPFN